MARRLVSVAANGMCRVWDMRMGIESKNATDGLTSEKMGRIEEVC